MIHRILLPLMVILTLYNWTSAQDTTVTRPDPRNPVPADKEVPGEWVVRTDRGADAVVSSDRENADIWFVNMVPGWHITTGPAAIFYHPGNTADGNYRVESEIHLFKPERNREAFGIFIGGKNLENENQSYVYFLLRNTGEYLIKKRSGSDTEVIQNWSDAPAMNRYTGETETSVKNTLAINVSEDTVQFLLNGKPLTSMPKSSVDTNGVVGLRVNHNLNLHISDLKVEEQ